ncbi:MAG: M16 family metallopeptidase, partial [Acidimicrobiales bacterium]
VLPSGVRLVTERMAEAQSVGVGVYVGVGGRDEDEPAVGSSHFLEHLLFKGTARRTARQIAEAIDATGGEMNAYTAREHTAFYVRLPARDLGLGLTILADVLAEPALRAPDVDAEREVILEELAAAEDDPEDLVHMRLAEAVFPHHSLGRDVLGTVESISALDRADIASFHTRWYRPANVVVAAVGLVEHDAVRDALAGFLADTATGDVPERVTPEVPPLDRVVTRYPGEQAHVALGWRSLDQDDPDRYALAFANYALGGGAASRLFQAVREERGLAYSVWSTTSLHSDSGSLTVYAATSPAKVAAVLAVVEDEVAGLLDGGITADEHAVALGFLEGSLLLALEDTASRMARLGRSESSRGEVVAVDEHIARLRAVTPDDVERVLRRVLGGPRSLAAVGPFDDLPK